MQDFISESTSQRQKRWSVLGGMLDELEVPKVTGESWRAERWEHYLAHAHVEKFRSSRKPTGPCDDAISSYLDLVLMLLLFRFILLTGFFRHFPLIVGESGQDDGTQNELKHEKWTHIKHNMALLDHDPCLFWNPWLTGPTSLRFRSFSLSIEEKCVLTEPASVSEKFMP